MPNCAGRDHIRSILVNLMDHPPYDLLDLGVVQLLALFRTQFIDDDLGVERLLPIPCVRSNPDIDLDGG